MAVRWTMQVEDGLQLMYSYMSAELECRMASTLECQNLDQVPNNQADCGKCKGCRNARALGAGLRWLGAQIDKHRR